VSLELLGGGHDLVVHRVTLTVFNYDGDGLVHLVRADDTLSYLTKVSIHFLLLPGLCLGLFGEDGLDPSDILAGIADRRGFFQVTELSSHTVIEQIEIQLSQFFLELVNAQFL
jgi:hypothetical protein